MKKKILGLLIVGLLFVTACPVCKAEEKGYFTQLGQTFTRGIKNVVSFPWEIPATIREYDQKTEGNPRVYRDTSGFFDGTFRALTRFGCGAWDMIFSLVPGDQQGLPLKPETFF